MERLRIKDEEEEEARTQLKQQAAKVTILCSDFGRWVGLMILPNKQLSLFHSVLKQVSLKELSDWYVQYADQLERLRATNR